MSAALNLEYPRALSLERGIDRRRRFGVGPLVHVRVDRQRDCGRRMPEPVRDLGDRHTGGDKLSADATIGAA